MFDSMARQVVLCLSSHVSQLDSVGAFLRDSMEVWMAVASFCLLSM